MKKILGLDLGTGSIGWAVVNEAETAQEQSSIVKLGVRIVPLTVDEQNNFESGKSITYATIVKVFKAMGAKSASLDLGSLGRVALW